MADSDISLFVLSWSSIDFRNYVLNDLCYSESTFFIYYIQKTVRTQYVIFCKEIT